MNEVTISMEGYARLIADAMDGVKLKKLIAERVNGYSGLSHADLKVLKDLYSLPDESEGTE